MKLVGGGSAKGSLSGEVEAVVADAGFTGATAADMSLVGAVSVETLNEDEADDEEGEVGFVFLAVPIFFEFSLGGAAAFAVGLFVPDVATFLPSTLESATFLLTAFVNVILLIAAFIGGAMKEGRCGEIGETGVGCFGPLTALASALADNLVFKLDEALAASLAAMRLAGLADRMESFLKASVLEAETVAG